MQYNIQLYIQYFNKLESNVIVRIFYINRLFYLATSTVKFQRLSIVEFNKLFDCTKINLLKVNLENKVSKYRMK
jgi:hypothetical protein